MHEVERLKNVINGLKNYAGFALDHSIVDGDWRTDMETVFTRCHDALTADPEVCMWWIGPFDDAPDDDDGWHTTCKLEDRCDQDMISAVADNTTVPEVIAKIGIGAQLRCPGCGARIVVKE